MDLVTQARIIENGGMIEDDLLAQTDGYEIPELEGMKVVGKSHLRENAQRFDDRITYNAQRPNDYSP